MAIAYRLEKDLGLTVTVFDGVITGEEWINSVRGLFADPAWPPGRLNLTDLRTADSHLLTDADRQAIYAINQEHAKQLVGMKSAAIAGMHFDETRDFERGNRSSGLRLIAFDDVGPACAWLGLDPAVVAPMINEMRDQLRGDERDDARP
jgi:hypothetical protein